MEIRLENIDIGYYLRKNQKKTILKDLNFEATSGEMVAIIGRNGSGKSTLLRSLSGIIQPLSGKVFLDKRSISEISRFQLSHKISFVSSHINQNGIITVSELVSFGRYPFINWLGQLKTEDKKIVEHSLEMVDLQKLADSPITEISDGEFQRTLIAKSLAQETPIILLDEPTAFLDIPNKHIVLKLLKNLCLFENKTVIFSTHDLDFCQKIVDKFWLINNNSVIEGAPEDFLLNGTIQSVFSHIEKINSDNLKISGNKDSILKINLQAKGKLYSITKTAIERIGIKICDSSNICVEAKINTDSNKNYWILKTKDSKNEFNSIYKIIFHLKQKYYG